MNCPPASHTASPERKSPSGVRQTPSSSLLRWRITLTVFITYAVFANFFGWIETSGLNLTRSLVDEGRLEIDSFCNLPGPHNGLRFFEFTGDRAYFRGHFYSVRPPFGPLLAVPAYYLFTKYLALAHGLNVTSVGIPQQYIPSFIFVCAVSTSAILGSLLALLMFDFSRHFIVKTRNRILVTFLFAFGTLLFNFSGTFFAHTPAAFFLFLSFYLLFECNSPNGHPDIRSGPRKAGFFSAIAFGCAVMNHYLIPAVAPALLLYLLLASNCRKCILPWVGGAAIMIGIFAAHNIHIFGKAADWTHNHYDGRIFTRTTDSVELENKSLIKKMPRIEWTISDRIIGVLQRIGRKDFILGTARLFVYPYRGLYFYNPILIFGLIGFVFLYRRETLFTVSILLGTALTVFFNILHTDWWGGGSFGPRYLVPLIPLHFVGLLAFLRWLPTARRKISISVIFGLGLFVNSICILSGLRDWVYHVGKPLDSAGAIMVHAVRNNSERMLDFRPSLSPLFYEYIPKLFSEGVESVLLEAIYGRVWSFPFNVVYLILLLGFLWLPVEKIRFKFLARK